MGGMTVDIIFYAPSLYKHWHFQLNFFGGLSELQDILPGIINQLGTFF